MRHHNTSSLPLLLLLSLLLLLLALTVAMPVLKSGFGYPRRFIFNSSDNDSMDRFASMEGLPIIMRNPVPYTFIEITRRGTHLANSVETTRSRAASIWSRLRSFFG